MKKKSVITLVSVVLNLVLFSALACFNKINSRADGVGAPFFLVQHLGEAGYVQTHSHEVTLASTVK
jgi:hypothetical protein